MKRLLLALAALALLFAFPGAASARIIEIGRSAGDTMPNAACPSRPCLAISRTTAYQAKVGPRRGLFEVPTTGRIVSWTLTMSKPGPKQIEFFDKALGGKSQAQLTVLRIGKNVRHRVVAQSPMINLQGYFGRTVQFPLERSIRVTKGSLIAVTVPTWAPILAVGQGGDTSWRSAGRGKDCEPATRRTAQTNLRDLAEYRCLYRHERLTFSATMITEPKPSTSR
jgi:hypothetical protein